MFFQNVGDHVPKDTVSHARRPESFFLFFLILVLFISTTTVHTLLKSSMCCLCLCSSSKTGNTHIGPQQFHLLVLSSLPLLYIVCLNVILLWYSSTALDVLTLFSVCLLFFLSTCLLAVFSN